MPTYSVVERELDELRTKRNQKFEEVAKACDALLSRPLLSAAERERAELLRAETHTMFEEFESAITRYERVLALNPQCARAVCGKGAIQRIRMTGRKRSSSFSMRLPFLLSTTSPVQDLVFVRPSSVITKKPGNGISGRRSRSGEPARHLWPY